MFHFPIGLGISETHEQPLRFPMKPLWAHVFGVLCAVTQVHGSVSQAGLAADWRRGAKDRTFLLLPRLVADETISECASLQEGSTCY